MVPAGHCISRTELSFSEKYSVEGERGEKSEEGKRKEGAGCSLEWVSCGVGWHVSLHRAKCACVSTSVIGNVVRKVGCTQLRVKYLTHNRVKGWTVLHKASCKIIFFRNTLVIHLFKTYFLQRRHSSSVEGFEPKGNFHN